MARSFDLGRSNEVLMNNAHFNIFKVMEHFLNYPIDSTGPLPDSDKEVDRISNGALWLDRTTNTNSADLKYYEDGLWKLLFGDRWKIICNLLDKTEPKDPVEGQLWINNKGILLYYHNGKWIPIKSIQYQDDDLYLEYEDFLIITPLKSAEKTVTNNFDRFIFTNGLKEWKPGEKYLYQQGVTYDDKIYVCLKTNYSNIDNSPKNTMYWTCLDILVQFLVPNSDTDKLFINGKYLHERIGKSIEDYRYNPEKTIGITFDNEDDSVVHTDLMFTTDDGGSYYYADLVFDDNILDAPGLSIDDKTLSITDESNISTSYDENSKTLTLNSDNISIVDNNVSLTKNQTQEILEKQSDDEEGYIKNTNISTYIKLEDIEKNEAEKLDEELYELDSNYKLVTGVHVNPRRLKKINKYFIKINKTNRIVQVPKENTEYYGIKDGIGTLLIENCDNKVYDYSEIIFNGKTCIHLTQKCVNKYDYVYAINYEFKSNISRQGKLFRKRINLSNETSIYIGYQENNSFLVFADGLYYAAGNNTYTYNIDDGYIYLHEKLLYDPDNRMDIMVVKFPKIYTGKITTTNFNPDNLSDRGYRVELNALPYNQEHCIGFLSGIAVDSSQSFKFYPDDLTGVYFTDINADYINNHGGIVEYAIIDTDFIESGELKHSLYRGKCTAEILDDFEIGIKVTRDKALIEPNSIFLDYTESPILFVDGLIVSQIDITITENYIIVDNLSEGQEVYVLADTNKDIDFEDIVTVNEITPDVVIDESYALRDSTLNEKIHEEDLPTSYIYEDLKYKIQDVDFSDIQKLPSDNILFDDCLGANTIQTEDNNSLILYLRTGLICDEKAVKCTKYPDEHYDGQVIYLKNSLMDAWMYWSEASQLWLPLIGTDVDENALGYKAYSHSFNILRPITYEERYCTYFAYKYGNSIEKKLVTGYINPDGIHGTAENKYLIRSTTNYQPSRNELSIYINGLRQNLVSPLDKEYSISNARECEMNYTNLFEFTVNGEPLKAKDGYYTYKQDDKYIFSPTELSNSGKLISRPSENKIFYVIEKCEGTEVKACDRYILTYKDAMASHSPYCNNAYESDNMNLSAGHIKVYIDGIRQPFGQYFDKDGGMHQAFKIIDSTTIQFIEPLIGGMGGNLGTLDEPKYPINSLNPVNYYKYIDEILIEVHKDTSLKEITLPLLNNKFEFSEDDGIDESLFETEDFVMIYINGLAYGSNYKIEDGRLKLKDKESLRTLINNNYKNYITFEWR